MNAFKQKINPILAIVLVLAVALIFVLLIIGYGKGTVRLDRGAELIEEK